MNKVLHALIVAILVALCDSVALADEIWTFYFIPNGSRPYYRSCYGDCWINGTAADLAGSFSIILNWQTHTGRLYTIDDRLVNVALDRGELIPASPSFIEHGLYTRGDSPEFGEGTFSDIGEGKWRVVSDGRIPISGGGHRLGTPYEITFGRTHAELSLTMQNDYRDAVSIRNAPAVLGGAAIAGDFNGDHRVDASDYVAWRKLSSRPAGNIWPIDYALWRTVYESSTAAGGGQSAPEPGAALLMAIGLVAISLCSHRSR